MIGLFTIHLDVTLPTYELKLAGLETARIEPVLDIALSPWIKQGTGLLGDSGFLQFFARGLKLRSEAFVMKHQFAKSSTQNMARLNIGVVMISAYLPAVRIVRARPRRPGPSPNQRCENDAEGVSHGRMSARIGPQRPGLWLPVDIVTGPLAIAIAGHSRSHRKLPLEILFGVARRYRLVVKNIRKQLCRGGELREVELRTNGCSERSRVFMLGVPVSLNRSAL